MPAASAEALAGIYGRIDRLVDGLTEADFHARTGCAAFSVKDLLFHQLLDAQRALLTLADPVDVPPDTDAVGYWRRYVEAADDELSHVLFVQRAAVAYGRPSGLRTHWLHTSRAAVAAARRAGPGTVSTQGHLIAVDDFVRTLVVEATLHYCDLTVEVSPGEPDLPEAAASVTRDTVGALLGAPFPAHWGAVETLRKATGRRPLDDSDRRALGPAADRVPVLR